MSTNVRACIAGHDFLYCAAFVSALFVVMADLCTTSECLDMFWDDNIDCHAYRDGGELDGSCGIDGRCRKCSCSCYDECTSPNFEGPCDGEPEEDYDSDDVRACAVCTWCVCECECATLLLKSVIHATRTLVVFAKDSLGNQHHDTA